LLAELRLNPRRAPKANKRASVERPVTRPKKEIEELTPIGKIDPDRVYRTNLSPQLFGYGPQRTRDLIKLRQLPPPFPLNAESTALAWTGRQILDYRAQMQKLAAEKLEAAIAAPKQEQPKALVGKVKKVKLRPPSATARQRGKSRAAS